MTVSLPFINKVLYLRVKAVLWAINYGLVPSRLILYVGNGEKFCLRLFQLQKKANC